jgi:hypothetical protein
VTFSHSLARMDTAVDIDIRDGVSIDSPWGDLGRDLALCLVSLGSKFLLTVLNRTSVVNGEALQQQVMHRPVGEGLLTVCNHTRCAPQAVTAWSSSTRPVPRLTVPLRAAAL